MGGGLRDDQGRANGTFQVDGDSDLMLAWACGLCGVRAQQRNEMVERTAPPALALKSHNSILSSMSLIPRLFELLPQHWRL